MELSQDLTIMAAFNWGWIQALLYSLRGCSWEELIEHPDIINLLANNDKNDDVIDIESGDAVHGSITTSIHFNKEINEWYLDDCFDVYDKSNNLVAENISFLNYDYIR